MTNNKCGICARECPPKCDHGCHKNIILGTATDVYGREVTVGCDYGSIVIGDFHFGYGSGFSLLFAEAALRTIEWNTGIRKESPEPGLAAANGITIQIRGEESQRWYLAAGLIHVIGHQGAALLLPPDRGISPQHAALDGTGPRWIVRDLGSFSGTWVNGSELAGDRPVEIGDCIRVGQTSLIVVPVQ